MGAAQVTMPEGTVNGPDKVLPRNSVFKIVAFLAGLISRAYFSFHGPVFREQSDSLSPINAERVNIIGGIRKKVGFSGKTRFALPLVRAIVTTVDSSLPPFESEIKVHKIHLNS